MQKITTATFVATAYTGAARDISRNVDIKHDSQHDSFCLKMLQAMSIKKLNISWKSLTNFFVAHHCATTKLSPKIRSLSVAL